MKFSSVSFGGDIGGTSLDENMFNAFLSLSKDSFIARFNASHSWIANRLSIVSFSSLTYNYF